MRRPGRPAGDEGRAAAHETALRLLAAQPRTCVGLDRKLTARGFPANVRAAVIERLVEVGLLDDRAYAEGYVRRRFRLGPRGFALMRRELTTRGVAGEVVDEVLREVAATTDEATLARDALRRREYRWAKLSPEVARRRSIAALRRLGFSSSAIAAALPRREAGSLEGDRS